MKYILIIFATAIIVFLGATVYYKGLPEFALPNGASVIVDEEATPIATQTPVPSDESEILIKAIETALVTKHGSDAAKLNVTVAKINEEYAQGGASGEGGGGMWFAARLNGIWTLVWDGNGIITCDDISPFPGFPVSMIPECWDTSTNKLITR
jgi:hypothetical protein